MDKYLAHHGVLGMKLHPDTVITEKLAKKIISKG